MNIFVRSVSQYLMDGFPSNLMGSFSMKQRYACCNLFVLKFFSSELWPCHEFLLYALYLNNYCTDFSQTL